MNNQEKANDNSTFNVLEYMRSISEVKFDKFKIATISDWTSCWLKHYCHNLKDTTLSAYQFSVKLHINRVLGDVLLTELRGEDVQLFINSLSMGIGIDEPLSPKSVRNIHGVLHKCLEVAMNNKYIAENPASFTILPKCEKNEFHAFTPNELNCFLDSIKNHSKRLLFTTAAFTGMRQAELIGLTWDCIDFDDGSIYIYRQLVMDKYTKKYSFSSLKNSKPRKIYPASVIMDLLHAYKQRNPYPKSIFVFNSSKGIHYTHAAVYNSFKKVVTKIGFPDVRFHDLRHTYAVLSIQAGDDIKTLQYNMGHHSAAFTLDVYGHCQIDMKLKSAVKMGLLINEKFPEIINSESGANL